METISILGVSVAQVTYADATARILAWAGQKGSTRTVVAANTHVATEAVLNPEYNAAISDADMVVPDGMPLVWASRLLGGTIRDRCYGPTLMERTLDESQATGHSHFLYGATDHTLEQAQSSIATRWPETHLAGYMAAPFGELDDSAEMANVARINAVGPDILWIGLGCPKQELWMKRYRQHLQVPVVLSVGAAFDFIAGLKPQAPLWMQKAGLEWLFRLVTEPRRLWRRYFFRNPYFVWQFMLQYFRSRCSADNDES